MTATPTDLSGSYLKFTRDIGQTPWMINGIRICASSVQEEMKITFQDEFNCDACILHAGGREDRDVRMLNSGRPFLLELVNPRIIKKYLFISKRLNKAFRGYFSITRTS